MDIRLVTTSFNDEVHGTFNDKKTGCGINLLKSENVTRYHRGGIMTDLGELTCEKCKTKIAKEMIKADQKEMKLLLKEEKLRAKKGIVDEGIVPLGNTTAKITKQQTAPEPVKPAAKPAASAPKPVEEKPAELAKTIPGTGVAIDDSLAQFAINKPQEAPAPEPEQKEEDFLAQFAVNKPEPEPEAPSAPAQDDFLAQFSVPNPAQSQREPAQSGPTAHTGAPVIDDISAAIAAMQTNISASTPVQPEPVQPQPVQPEPVQQAAPPQEDDILSMFSIESPAAQEEAPAGGMYDNDSDVIDVEESSLSAIEPENVQTEPVQPEPAVEEAAAEPEITDASEWDLIANQLFGVNSVNHDTPAQPGSAPVQETAPVIEDVAAAVQTAQQNVPQMEEAAEQAVAPVQQAVAPVIDDITSAVEAAQNNVPKYEEPVQQATAPVIDDIASAVEAAQNNAPKFEKPVQQATAPVIDDIASAVEAAQNNVPKYEEPVQQAVAPVIDDITSAVEAAQNNVPKFEKPVQQATAPVIDDITSAVEAAQNNVPKFEKPVQQATAPVIDDITSAVEAAQNNVPKFEKPVQQATAPVIDDIASAVAAAQNNVPKYEEPVQQTAAPVQQPAASAPVIDDISAAVSAAAMNAPKAVAPVKPAPVKAAPKPAAPAPAPVQQAPAPGMPATGQIISVPQITGYDAAKQPIYTYVQMQITGYSENGQPVLSPIPGQEIPEFEMPFNKNTRLQEAIRAAQEVPTSSKDMTPGQRIAAADAARGSHISANVSKIATNPHAKATSQAFINAISESKEYANQSLTDTQGLQQRTRVIGSIEDVLSQLGDNSLKQKKAVDAQVQQSIPTFQEYKAPTRTASPSPIHRTSAPKPAPIDDRPLTKAELKALKKQEKIDAKFRKEMAKRGG